MVESQVYIPDMNDDYWTYSFKHKKSMCFEFTYAQYDIDNLDSGNCFKTEEEAYHYGVKEAFKNNTEHLKVFNGNS